MSGEIWVNDIDLGDYGFYASEGTKGHADSPEIQNLSVATQGWPGQIWAGEAVLGAQRILTIGGHISAATNAALLSALDNIKAIVQDGAVRIRTSDRPTQEYRDARCKTFADARRAALFTGVATDLTLGFELATPQRFDINPLGYALSTARTSCPLGTAPSRPVIILSTGGSATAVVNPVITVRDQNGNPLQTMGFTGSIAQNDFWRIDSLRALITKSIAGTASDGSSLWTSGDFPVLRPSDAWYELAAWPTVELSSSSGTPVGMIDYSRQWL